MRTMTINIDRLESEIENRLDIVQQLSTEVVEEAVKKTAKQTVKDIKENIDSAGIKGTGAYKKSWKYKRDSSLKGKWACSMVVYSEIPHLPHLLEHGHAKVNGGRTREFPHIAPSAKSAADNLEKFIKEGIENDAR